MGCGELTATDVVDGNRRESALGIDVVDERNGEPATDNLRELVEVTADRGNEQAPHPLGFEQYDPFGLAGRVLSAIT